MTVAGVVFRTDTRARAILSNQARRVPVLVEPLTLPLSELSHAVPTQSGVSAIGVPGDIADPLQSFLVQMDMSPSVGSLYEGEIKDYATLGGYILFQKPDRIRIVGTD